MNAYFAQPEALWLLVLLPALGLLAGWAWWRRRRALALLGEWSSLHRLLSVRLGPRLLHGGCLALGLAALVLGIAGPQWGREDVEAARGRDVVVVLDLSRSMLAEQPSRQERARRALLDLCDAVQQRGGHRLALIVFAAHPKVVCPLTHDYDHFRDVLARQDAAEPPPTLRPHPGDAPSGTRIGEALRLAVDLRDPAFPAGQDILLLSDGDDPAADGEWAEGAAAAKEQRIPVHTVGIGDPDKDSPIPTGDGVLKFAGKVVMTRLHERPLEEIARRTGGVYVSAQTRPLPLGRWLREVIEPRKLERPEEDVLPVYQQHPAWFFAAALGLLALTLLPSGGRKPPEREIQGAYASRSGAALLLLALVGIPALEKALRQGNDAYHAEQYDQAVDNYSKAEERTTDPGLVAFNKAAALFRLGRYREAELHYRRCLDDARGLRRARALYDLGNCLLWQARDQNARLLEQAIACYRACRRLPEAPPDLLADAEHNLELARLLWLKARAASGEEQPANEEGGSESPHKDRPQDKSGPDGLGSDNPKPQAGQAGKEKQVGQEKLGQDQKTPVPGAGTLPTLPDTDELVPLSPEDTAAYLERLAERVRQERRDYWRSAVPAVPNVKDW
jgi:Ca-activated chloride channel family protein